MLKKTLLTGLLTLTLIAVAGCSSSSVTKSPVVNRDWMLVAKDPLIIGGYGDNFAYDGRNVREADGKIDVAVNSVKNTGAVVAVLKNAKVKIAKDTVLEGEIKLVMKSFKPIKPFMQGGIAENIYIHGDTGRAPPIMPKMYSFVAGWGVIDIYVNGVLTYSDLDGHFMMTEKARRDKKITNDKGVVYNPKHKSETGFTDPKLRELHIVAHSEEKDVGNFPPFSKFLHLNFQDVSVKKAPAGVSLKVPQ